MHRASRLFSKTMFGGGAPYQNSTVGSVVQQWYKNKTTIYLRRIKWVTGRAELESHFGKFGEIKDISMFFDPDTGLHRGHASITFKSAKSAEEAIEGGPHHIDGVMITADLDRPKPLDNMMHAKFSLPLQNHMTPSQPSESHYQPPQQPKQNTSSSTRPATTTKRQRRWTSMSLGKTVNSSDGME